VQLSVEKNDLLQQNQSMDVQLVQLNNEKNDLLQQNQSMDVQLVQLSVEKNDLLQQNQAMNNEMESMNIDKNDLIEQIISLNESIFNPDLNLTSHSNQIPSSDNQFFLSICVTNLENGYIHPYSLNKMLQRCNLDYTAIEVTGDGHCFFRAIAYESLKLKSSGQELKKYRMKIFNYYQNRKDFFKSLWIDFLDDRLSNEIEKNIKDGYVDNADFIKVILSYYLEKNIKIYMIQQTDFSIFLASETHQNFPETISILHNGLSTELGFSHYYFVT
jgi:hypothetical protein